MNAFREELRAIRKQCESGEVRRRTELLAEEFSKKPVVLYGAGTLGPFVMDHLAEYGVKVECYCDTYRSGVHPTGVKIIPSHELNDAYPDAVVVITSETHGKAILERLEKIQFSGRAYSFDELLGFYTIPYSDFEQHEEGYACAYDIFADDESKRVLVDSIRTRLIGTPMESSPCPQYFDPVLCPLTDNEIFVDGGCFVGDTTEEFIRQTCEKYTHIYGFEPDKSNLNRALANLAKYPNIDVQHGGLWHMTNTCRFASGGLGNSRFELDGDTIANTFGLDEFFADKHAPTFIKMDIEGAECMALSGAAKLIKSHRPKLAVCTYHSLRDMYAVPQKILSLNPGYTLALRHYSHWYAESVCYAV